MWWSWFRKSGPDVPLVPQEAVDGDGGLWLAENGTAIHYALEEPDYAGQMVQVPWKNCWAKG